MLHAPMSASLVPVSRCVPRIVLACADTEAAAIFLSEVISDMRAEHGPPRRAAQARDGLRVRHRRGVCCECCTGQRYAGLQRRPGMCLQPRSAARESLTHLLHLGLLNLAGACRRSHFPPPLKLMRVSTCPAKCGGWGEGKVMTHSITPA